MVLHYAITVVLFSLDIRTTAQAELQAEQAEMADQLKVNLRLVERRTTQVLVAAVVAAVFALAGIIVALL